MMLLYAHIQSNSINLIHKFDDLFWLNLHKEKDEVILHPFDLASTIAFPYLVSLNIPACSFISLALESAASVSASLPRSHIIRTALLNHKMYICHGSDLGQMGNTDDLMGSG